MRVEHVSYRNFKGHTAAFALSPVTLIAGGNFTHKTSIPLAIRLALAGYLPPPIGVKGIYSLAGDPEGPGEMEIALRLDTGRTVPWKWKRDASGKVSTSGAIAPDIAMPELLMDPRLFFAKTAAEQVQTVFSACNIRPEEFDAAQVLTSLSAIQAPPPVDVFDQSIARIGEWMQAHPITHVATWLAELVDTLKQWGKSAADEQKVASGAFAAFRGENASAPQVDVTPQLDKARQDLAELLRLSDTEGLEEQRRVIGQQLLHYESLETYAARIEELKPLASPVTEDDDPEELIDDLTVRAGSYTQVARECEGQINLLKTQYAELEQADSCPVCKAKRPGWKKKAMEDMLAETSRIVALKEKEETAANEALKRLGGLRNAQELQRTIKLHGELKGLLDTIARIEGLLAERRTSSAGSNEKIAALRAQIADLEEKQRAHDVHQRDRERRNNLEQRLLAAQCQVETYKAAVKVVLEEQSILVDKAFTGVLRVARHFTDGLLNSQLEFVDGQLGRRVSALDQKTGCRAPINSWIPFSTFSGTEELLALAGFGVALTADAPIKLVILDELGRLEPQRRRDVVLRMLSLVETGVIDQSILIDVDPKPYAALGVRKGFSVLTLQ